MILALHSMCIDIDSDAFQVEVILEGRYCVDLSLVASTQCGSREQLRTRKKYCISNYIECILHMFVYNLMYLYIIYIYILYTYLITYVYFGKQSIQILAISLYIYIYLYYTCFRFHLQCFFASWQVFPDHNNIRRRGFRRYSTVPIYANLKRNVMSSIHIHIVLM